MTEPTPTGSNADEWHLFLCSRLDNRAQFPDGLTYVAVHIAEALDACAQRARAEALEEVYRHITALMSECLPHYPEYRALFEARSIVHALIQPAPESK